MPKEPNNYSGKKAKNAQEAHEAIRPTDITGTPESIKKFLLQNNFINEEWNALNILNQQASSVGAIDLGMYLINENNNFLFFDKLKGDNFKFIYLLGADNFNFEKKDKFIVYQGSHGDRGAEIADIILPGAAYTEKNGLFVNLEGKLQNAYKASYPPGEAREDWVIFKNLSNMMNKKIGFEDLNNLKDLIINQIQNKDISKKFLTPKLNLIKENIIIEPIDYYYTNPIARSSKVMTECRKISKNYTTQEVNKAS